ncbi:hypothetical protein [Frondihabitans sp. PhB188]|uniref:hypothetical protein n=1 Tax=Frondihabitans sp. PhB188 TaxID=2485200 RepID=UPI0011CD9C0C|nr:hypothetical protein [Frondihabitans sp. PhB188]
MAFIDDEIDDREKPAYIMRKAMEADGRPVAAYSTLPDVAAIRHWQSLSFLVLDWDLSPGSYGGSGASTLSGYARDELFRFLQELLATVFCPIFIISAEDVADIQRQLEEDHRFGGKELDTRIKVFGKSAVVDDLINDLSTWVENNLALSVLRVWEQEYEKAKNRLFIDLNKLDSNWPIYVWQNAIDDKVEPSFELATTLTANLLHRIDLVKFDTETMLAASENAQLASSAMRKVLNGRTVIPANRLHLNVVMPGDMFFDSENPDQIWLNLTPACHTVPGRLKDGEDMRLFVVPGTKQPHPPSKTKFTDLNRDNPNSFVVHVLHDDSPYIFNLKASEYVLWSEAGPRRVGRLLAPYITRAQQANAMFMQIEGVPRTSYELYKPGEDSTSDPSVTSATSAATTDSA